MSEFYYESDELYYPDGEHKQVSRGLKGNNGKAYIIKTLLNWLVRSVWENVGLVLFFLLDQHFPNTDLTLFQ